MDVFDYELPPERIAQRPAEPRDASRLLVLDRSTGTWRDGQFTDVVQELAAGDLLIVNDTRVFPARLYASGDQGGRVEFLLTRPADANDPARSEGREWWSLARPARRARPGRSFRLTTHEGGAGEEIVAVVGTGEAGMRRIRLEVADDPWDWISRHGHVPLPLYIARPDEEADRDRYQTVYATERGAVAAPTAGLHFTTELLERLSERGVERASLTLHVGPGTFRPVTAECAEDHVMDPEWYRIPAETRRALVDTRAAGGRVVAVGTTTDRALETAASGSGMEGDASDLEGWSDLTIRPGHEFQLVDAMVTNFHLPRSSLLLLVSAFAGTDRILAAYRHAVAAGYRFYSYGDAMLIV
ncbi:MAG: tRNA preQ1(34) S-adenosylmethionine ribosyltransferase-isomerase QueA [Gemmatimonadota bacterium]